MGFLVVALVDKVAQFVGNDAAEEAVELVLREVAVQDGPVVTKALVGQCHHGNSGTRRFSGRMIEPVIEIPECVRVNLFHTVNQPNAAFHITEP